MKYSYTLALSIGIAIATPSQGLADTFKENAKSQQLAASELDHSVLSYYVSLMSRKIRSNVNMRFCPPPKYETQLDSITATIVEIQLTNTGTLSESPKLLQGSGDVKCDEAVLKAVQDAQPFDLPNEHPEELKKMLDRVQLKFRAR